MKILNQEVSFDIENKKRAAICCGVILLCLGYTVVNFFSDKPAPQTPSIPETQQGAEKTTDSAAAGTISIHEPGLDDLLKVNPFVELKNMAIVASSGMPLPAIPQGAESRSGSGLSSFAPHSIPLPAIPGHNSVPVPSSSMPSSSPPAPASQSGAANVRGILTGDDGENIAIMSDGRVVQKGDTYHDGRIAYIGGDGITFEDGHSISYK